MVAVPMMSDTAVRLAVLAGRCVRAGRTASVTCPLCVEAVPVGSFMKRSCGSSTENVPVSRYARPERVPMCAVVVMSAESSSFNTFTFFTDMRPALEAVVRRAERVAMPDSKPFRARSECAKDAVSFTRPIAVLSMSPRTILVAVHERCKFENGGCNSECLFKRV